MTSEPAEIPVVPPIVIGCGSFRHFGRFELLAFRVNDGADTVLCFQTKFAGEREPGITCPERPEGDHIQGGFGQIDNWLLLSGMASEKVARVRIRYRSYGRLKNGRAFLAKVTDPALLGRLGENQPFGVYNAEAYAHARFYLTARSRTGKLLGYRSIDLRTGLRPLN